MKAKIISLSEERDAVGMVVSRPLTCVYVRIHFAFNILATMCTLVRMLFFRKNLKICTCAPEDQVDQIRKREREIAV